MNIKQYCQHLHDTKKSVSFNRVIKEDNKKSEIIEATKFLSDDVSISNRIYCIRHDITQIPKCGCGKTTKFKQYSFGYREFCSTKCSSNSSSKKETIKKTNIEKYGHENAFHSPNGRESWSEFQSDKNRVKKAADKGQQTLKENYGVDTVEEAQQIRAAIALKAHINKYGCVFNNREQAIKNRDEKKMVEALEKTCMEKYGVQNAMQTPETFKKCMKAVYKRKEYIYPSGRVDEVQGFEPLAIDDLLIKYNEDELVTDIKLMPQIWYMDKDNKTHRYYPDIYIPKTNQIIEVKSDYTMKADYEKNKLKEKACFKAGFDFQFMVYDGKGNRVN